MIIGIDASRVFRVQKTGTEWYSYELIKALSGVECRGVVRLYGAQSSKMMRLPLSSAMHYRQLWWPMARLWTQGRLSLEMLRKPPDVLFVPSHVIPLIHPKKTVTTLHDVGFVHWQQAYTPKEWQYLDWSTRYALKQCPRIITVSQFSKDELVRIYGAQPDAIEVIHLGYDRERYCLPASKAAVSAEVRSRFGVTGRYLIMTGRIDHRKNQAFLVAAFEQIAGQYPDLQLVLVGPLGRGGSDILDAIKTSPYQERIIVHGWVPEEDKILLLQGAEAMVFPSLYEGFGLPVIEAQACGVPVVAARNSAIPETTGEGALYFGDADIEECVASIQRILDDVVVREHLVTAGSENILRFSWHTCAQQTIDVLQQVGRSGE